MTKRKNLIHDHVNSIAQKRERWRKKNAEFHKGDLRYLQFLVPEGNYVLDLGCGTGSQLAHLKPRFGVGLDFSAQMVEIASRQYPHLYFYHVDIEQPDELYKFSGMEFDYIILSDTLGYLDDCQAALSLIRNLCSESTKIIITYYSPVWEPILKIAEALGLKMPQPEMNYLGPNDVMNLLHLADFEPIKTERQQLIPARLAGLGRLINKYLATLPLIRLLTLRHFVVARSITESPQQNESVSIVIPCRNERGNVEPAIQRLPKFCEDIEILFVEGNSSDGTLEECQRVKQAYWDVWTIHVLQQPEKGKNDAVRCGFENASGEILMILDGDLTVPPESLSKFYDVIRRRKGEFVNGTRLVYPMERGAMRFLNYWANRAFAFIFSFLLNQRFTDTLCGTKCVRKSDYEKIKESRKYFGDFDPFGDFDLIFGSAKSNLKILEVPVRYAERTYGQTQISRFRDGWLLLKMVIFAWRKMKAL